jgi:hypothetical protein
MTRADRKAQKLQAQCDEFNATTKIGDEVLVKKDNGQNVITRTSTEAQVLSGHTAVIWLEGISGAGWRRVMSATPGPANGLGSSVQEGSQIRERRDGGVAVPSEAELIEAERLVDGVEALIEACDRYYAADAGSKMRENARRERKQARHEIEDRYAGTPTLRRLIELARQRGGR